MVVSFLLIFLATAWIAYVYLDRHKHFSLPGSPAKGTAVAGAAGSSIGKVASVVKQRGILGNSRPHMFSSPPTGVSAGPPIEPVIVPAVNNPDEPAEQPNPELDDRDQHPDENGDAETEFGYQYLGDNDPVDGDGFDENDLYTREPEQGNEGGENYPFDDEDGDDEDGSASNSIPKDDETSTQVDDSGFIVFVERSKPLHEAGKPSIVGLQRPIINQVGSIGLNTTEYPEDQEDLEKVNPYEDGFSSYKLDEVMNEVENQPLQEAAKQTPHYRHRDLSLSEYAKHFRTLRQGALAIRKELDRTTSKAEVHRMATDYMRYVGTIGLTQDNNVLGLIHTAVVGTASPIESVAGNGEDVRGHEYASLFSKMQRAHATGQDVEVL